MVTHLLRRRGKVIHREGLLFATDFSRGFSPLLFRDWLPRDLRRRVKSGEGIFSFLMGWQNAFERIRQEGARDPAGLFDLSIAELVREKGEEVDTRWASSGLLIWRPEGGVPYPRGASLSHT